MLASGLELSWVCHRGSRISFGLILNNQFGRTLIISQGHGLFSDIMRSQKLALVSQ